MIKKITKTKNIGYKISIERTLIETNERRFEIILLSGGDYIIKCKNIDFEDDVDIKTRFDSYDEAKEYVDSFIDKRYN